MHLDCSVTIFWNFRVTLTGQTHRHLGSEDFKFAFCMLEHMQIHCIRKIALEHRENIYKKYFLLTMTKIHVSKSNFPNVKYFDHREK